MSAGSANLQVGFSANCFVMRQKTAEIVLLIT